MKILQQSIVEQFRNYGRIINEWRDTLGYSALVLTELTIALKTKDALQLTNIPLYAGVREFGRFLAWEYGNEAAHAGVAPRPKPSYTLANDALTVSMAAEAFKFVSTSVGQSTLQDVSSIPSLLTSAAFACLATVCFRKGDGLKSLTKGYSEIMWDYPRKKNGGGPAVGSKFGKYFSPYPS